MSALDQARAAFDRFKADSSFGDAGDDPEFEVIGNALLAVAEELRMANLIAIAQGTGSPVGGQPFPLKAREQVARDVLDALGIDYDPTYWEHR